MRGFVYWSFSQVLAFTSPHSCLIHVEIKCWVPHLALLSSFAITSLLNASLICLFLVTVFDHIAIRAKENRL